MENDNQIASFITKSHFTKIHEKVQLKSNKLLKRLEKSKSIDILHNIDPDFDHRFDRRYASVCNLNEAEQEFVDVKKEETIVSNETILVSNAHNNKADTYKIYTNDIIVVEPTSLQSLDSDPEENTENNFFFDKNTFKTSLESLNEAAKESDESIEQAPLTPRSIRDRIGSTITAARKRRQEKKERLRKEKEKLKESPDKVESFILSNSHKHDILRFDKKNKLATVTVAFIEVTGLDENTEDKPRALTCRFRLGAEKRKSKTVKSHKDIVKFQEIFNFNLFDDENIFEVSLWDKDILLGRNEKDLSTLKKEKTHQLKISLKDCLGSTELFLLLTISGTSITDTVYDIDEKTFSNKLQEKRRKYAWYHLCGKYSDVGHLWVIAYGAKGLASNDCYCVFTINNESVRTLTDYKTNAPSWMKILSFTVTDITSTLEVVVWDEKKAEEIGKVSLPLLSMKTNKKWYALKDSTEKNRAKGNNPRILLETHITWNIVKASVRIINLKEPNYLEMEEKLDRHVLAKNISRCKAIISWVLNMFRITKTLFQWESWKLNVVALATWITFFSFAEIWVIPLLFLMPFLIYNFDKITNVDIRTKFKRAIFRDYDKESKNDKDEKSVSLRQKINSWQEMIQLVQNTLGKLASIGERIKKYRRGLSCQKFQNENQNLNFLYSSFNTSFSYSAGTTVEWNYVFMNNALYNFSLPFVSYVAIFLIISAAFFMYLLPFNYICIVWGIHKFTQKILRPNRIPHNEIMDLLSRVPDDDALVRQEELAIESMSEDDDC